MTIKKTYKDYKDFFEEVNKSNRNKTYHWSYVLLFSFYEDRVNQIFKTQHMINNDCEPNKEDMKDSIYRKLRDINRWGIKVSDKLIDFLIGIHDRRNTIVHDALFNIQSVTKKDVEDLEKVGRHFNKMREKQKKDNPKLFPKLSKRDKLFVRVYGRIPSHIK
jgi:hypothetical protein